MPVTEPRRHASWTTAAIGDVATFADRRGLRYRADEALARHTTMGVGGPCPLMIWPRRRDDVAALAGWAANRGLPWRALGGGSNLLVNDTGIEDAVFNTAELVEGVAVEDETLVLPAGLATASALRESARRGLDGLVWTAGLPGTVGGAAAGNAGCWGGDMAAVTRCLDVVDGAGALHRVEAPQMRWSYRNLELPAALPQPWTIVTVGVVVNPADPRQLQKRYAELQERKRSSQPVGARNSGCIFRNPDNGEPAGRLIDQAGAKGLRVGDAEVSPRHANFIVNRGAARAADVEDLVQQIIDKVAHVHGVRLRPEIRRW